MDKAHYFIISVYLGTIIKKENDETSMLKNVSYFEYHI